MIYFAEEFHWTRGSWIKHYDYHKSFCPNQGQFLGPYIINRVRTNCLVQ